MCDHPLILIATTTVGTQQRHILDFEGLVPQAKTHITVGVTGGIAVYKAVELVRALQGAGLDPHVVMTHSAQQFIAPLTFAAITGHRVITSLWPSEGLEGPGGGEDNLHSAIDHIDEAQSTRALVVAPATAHTLAQFAHGLADDFLTTLYLATTAPVIVAPAMNVNMWHHPATQANLQTLRERNVRIAEPGNGYLACGMTGAGRLADTADIVATVMKSLASPSSPKQDLAGEVVLITAGGTREPLDPVRYIGNRSSGRMGYALASAAAGRGARVLLVTAARLPTPAYCEEISVDTAEEMRSAVHRRLAEATIVIKAAAVADFRPVAQTIHKLKRGDTLTLELEPTPDIAREVAAQRRPGTLLITFAAETDSAAALSNARAKLVAKGADAVFLNDVSNPAFGFDSAYNTGTWIIADKEVPFAPQLKEDLATALLDHIIGLRVSA